MSATTPIGIIELGDTNIKCLIFKVSNDNETEILSTSITPAEGIHNDVIINLAKATKTVRSCISLAEKKAKISLKKINVIFEQPDFLCTKFSKNKKIDGSKIHKDDIEFLLNEAKKQLILNDKNQSVIHIFNHNYLVDGKIFIEEPIDVYANSLTHEMTFITTKKNNLKNIKQVFIECDIEVDKFIARTFALGAELLNDDELKFGSIIIDLGFEKTSLALFKNFAPVHSITFPIGTNHITKDISKVCSLSMEESENIRNNIDFLFQKNNDLFDKDNYLKNNYFVNSNFRKISKNLVLNIIKARIDEIIDELTKQLIVPGFNLNSGISLVLEGGSNLKNIKEYFSNSFGANLKKIEYSLTNDFKRDFSSCLGAIKVIKDGWETEAIPEPVNDNVKKFSFFGKIFKI